MAVKIQLSIQEILNDFEKLVRWDERLAVHFENQSADDEDIEKFFNFVEEMALKYLPSYSYQYLSKLNRYILLVYYVLHR